MNRITRIKSYWLYCILLGLATVTNACGDEDDYVYPNALTEMVEIQTDKEGMISTLINDNAEAWTIENTQEINHLRPDTLYRMLAMYAPVKESTNSAHLYALTQAVSPIPVPRALLKNTPTDAVDLQGIWVSSRYLNITVVVKVKDKAHSYHFIQDSITTDIDGHKSLNLTFLHNRNDDVEGYNKTVYLSVPLWPYKNELHQGDRIIFSLNTYKQGLTSRTFEFPAIK